MRAIGRVDSGAGWSAQIHGHSTSEQREIHCHAETGGKGQRPHLASGTSVFHAHAIEELTGVSGGGVRATRRARLTDDVALDGVKTPPAPQKTRRRT